MLPIEQIKQLREETGVSIGECKKALETAGGDIQKAKDILRQWGRQLAEKKAERVASQGIIDSYIHNNKKVGVLVELRCESDFVARSEDFTSLSKEICLQIAAMDPQTNDEVFSQPWIKDSSKTLQDLFNEKVAKLGENIQLAKFIRYEL